MSGKLITIPAVFDSLKEHNNDGTHKGAYVVLVSEKGAANGVAELDASSLIPLSRLPSTLTGKDADTLDGYHATGLAKAGANFDITSIAGLTTPLSRAQGGSGYNQAIAPLFAYQHVPVSVTGVTTETTLFTATVPANTMGANGVLDIQALLYANNSANAKTVRLYFGETLLAVGNIPTGSVQGLRFLHRLFNRNAANSQIFFGSSSGSSLAYSFGAVNVVMGTPAIDTTQNQSLTITGQLANAADTIRCEAVDVEVLRP